MKYLKLYENSFNKQDKSISKKEIVENICKKYRISIYTINDDLSIDVHGDVRLSNMLLDRLPLKFRNVYGNFYCNNNNLFTLEGCPTYLYGTFYCHNNNLFTLEGCPTYIHYGFNCGNNNLTNLEFAPSHVGGAFWCNNNNLTSLEGIPEKIKHLNILGNNVRSFEYFPSGLNDFICTDNPIYNIWQLLGDSSKIELFNDYDIIRDDGIILDRLNDFLLEIGKDPVDSVKGYKNLK